MQARHVGERRRVTASLHPKAKQNVDQVYKQIWKDVKKNRVLVVAQDNPALAGTISSPFEAVDKMMPDRSVSEEKRIVHDQRGVNHFTDKGWHPPALQPTHDQIARRILWMQTRYPGVPVLMAKKDIAGAFRLLWVSPMDTPLFAGDLPWKPEFMVKSDEDGGEKAEGKAMTVVYLVSSFGFSGSPGEWTPWGRATEEYHRAHKPAEPRRDGAAGFDCKILVDDAILVEAAVGLRPWASASCYEKGVRLMLGEAAVNEEKDAIEGTFKQEQVIWGLVMNTATNTVALPERRILKGAHLLTEPEFEAGCYALKLRQLQQFRGIMTGWAVVVRGLKNELKAADLFLTNGDGAMPVKPRKLGYRDEEKAEEQAWEDLWALFEACKWLAARSETWEMKFGAKLEELLPPIERLSRPGSLGRNAVFVSADATRSIIGAIDWSNGFVTRAKVVDLQPWLQEVLVGESDDEEALIHITEMLAIVALACRLGEKWVGKVIVYAGDNQVVRSWIEKRQSGSRVGRMLVRMLALCEMRYRFFVVAGWWRTYHNVDSDFITRCSDEEYEEVIAKRGWTAVRVDEDVAQAAIDSRRFGPCFLAWSDPEDRRVMMQLKERRLERMVDRPIRVAWENFAVQEWVPEGRTVKDFELVARSCGAEGTVLIVAGTFGCDVQGKHVKMFIDYAEEKKAEVVVAEGPSQVQWEAIEEWCAQKGWHTGRLEFISTEFGEAMARRRIAVIGMRDTITSEMAEMSVVRAVVGAPVASRMSATAEVEDLLWKNPARLTLAPGVVAARRGAYVVGREWT